MITSDITSQLTEKFADIENSLLKRYDEQESLGLMSGKAGIAIFFSYLKKHTGSSRYDEVIEKCLIDSLEMENHRMITYCTGLTGALWAAELLKKNKILELDENMKDVYSEIASTISFQLQNGNIDFLHGAIGNMFALLDMDPECFNIHENEFLRLLKTLGEENEYQIKWKVPTWITMEKSTLMYNSSLSHGSSSIIILLAEILNANRDSKLAEELLVKACNYILSTKNTGTENGFIFPSIMSPDGEVNSESSRKLAWCYGDFGIGLALYKAGIILKDEKFEREGLETLVYCSHLRTNDQINDACICHGSAGLAIGFKTLFERTGINDFDVSAHYWLEQTIAYAENEVPDCAGYQFYNGITKKFQPVYTMLEGLTGVGLTMLSFMSEEKFGWERCFLIR